MVRQCSAATWAAVLVVLLTVGLSADEEADKSAFYARGIRTVLVSSPDHFIAAVVQRTSTPKCNVDGLGGCFAQYRVEELVEYKGEGLTTPPRRFKLLCGADLGAPRSRGDELALVIATPVPSTDEVYGASFMAGSFSQEDRKRFSQIVLDVLAELAAPD
jgi:hypothetical protein